MQSQLSSALRHMLATDAWSDDEIRALLERARELKTAPPQGGLEGKTLGMLFFNPSLRTRLSFEVAMNQHGGSAVCLEPGVGCWQLETRTGVVMDGQAAEHLTEAAAVCGRYVDVLGVRAFPNAPTWQEARLDEVVKGFAEHAGVPVINLESARRHPCQGLADALTLYERFGSDVSRKKFVLSWAYHPKPLPTAVPVSACLAAARLGCEVVVAHPQGFELDSEDMASIEAVANRNHGSVSVCNNLEDAADGADVIYAKSWGSLSCYEDIDAEKALRAPHKDWQITDAVMDRTRDGHGGLMHCLPVRRNVVVSDAVLDSPRSWVVDQAENRLHAQRALLLALLQGESL